MIGRRLAPVLPKRLREARIAHAKAAKVGKGFQICGCGPAVEGRAHARMFDFECLNFNYLKLEA